MLPECYRSFDTATLLDLVSYGDPEDEEPPSEEPIPAEGEPAFPREVSSHRRQGESLLRRGKRRWVRLGRRLIARARLL
jgi:hypothetical protein